MPKARVRRRLLLLGAASGDTGDGFATASGTIAVIVTIALGVLVGSALGRALSR